MSPGLSYIYDKSLWGFLMNTADVRINARLSGHDAIRFQTLLKQSGRSASELLREALREYHTSRFEPKPDPVELLADFVGAGEGPADLSARYKAYLGDSLAHKLAGYVQDCDDSDR